MFRLYDKNVNKLIVEKAIEEELFPTIENKLKIYPTLYMMIINKLATGDEIVVGIRKEEDYINYRKEYEYRKITGKSCFQLKKEILDRKFAKK